MSDSMRKVGLALLILAVVGGIAAYLYYTFYGRYFEDTNDARIQVDQVAIASKLAGYVKTVAVSDNQQVAADALLVEIDPIDYETKLAAAEADIAAMVAAEKASRASHAEMIAGVAAARANLEAAQANLAYAQREVDRYGPLVAKGIQPASMLSQWTAARDRAAAEVAAQRAAILQAERRVESITAQIAQLEARIEAAKVQREAAANDLAFTRITAPATGRVANSTVRVGQFVQPGTRLMTIVPDNGLYVVANFKETQLGLMRPGQPATIRVDALPDIEFTGKVKSITPGTGANFSLIPPQNATGNFTKIVQRVPVHIHIDAGPAARRLLVPGLSLEVTVDTRSGRTELEAIRKEQKS